MSIRVLAVFAAVWVVCVSVPYSVQAQDAARGEGLFQMCAGCHGLTPRSDDQAPSLGGVVGRKAGSVPDFEYSRAMASADFVWDETRLDAFLANPQAVVPGTRMPLSTVAEKADRADIIAYLKAQH